MGSPVAEVVERERQDRKGSAVSSREEGGGGPGNRNMYQALSPPASTAGPLVLGPGILTREP